MGDHGVRKILHVLFNQIEVTPVQIVRLQVTESERLPFRKEVMNVIGSQ